MRRSSLMAAAQRAMVTSPYFHDGISLDFRQGYERGCYVKVPGGAITRASLTTLFTFTGGNQSMYRGPNGLLIPSATNTPRIEYDANGNPLGLLMEASRTNLIVRSQANATSPWFNSGFTSVANNTGEVTDPAGGNNATKIVSSGAAAGIGCGATLTAAVHTGSWWLRCASGTVTAQLIVYLSSSPFTSIGTAGITITTQWQRFTVVTSTATAASYNLQLNGPSAGTIYSYGAQLEAGAFATSYIPTAAASVARTADSCVRTLGSEFSATAGTVFVRGRASGGQDAGNQFVYAFGGTNSILFLRPATTDIARFNPFTGTAQGPIDSTFVNATSFRAAMVYNTNDLAMSFNGGTIQTDTSATLGSYTSLYLGSESSPALQMNGHILTFDYWPVRQPNGFLTSV